MTKRWTAQDIPSQRGRTIVVTGTGGLGFEDALALARAGGDVILAGRNPAKGKEAVDRIRASVPNASISFEVLDLARLDSVAAFGARLGSIHDKIDILINNAGVMTPPRRQITQDGYELQFGVNYLAHFALSAHLLPWLRRGRNPRVVTLSSVAARAGTIDFDDLQSERSYKPMRAYSQSKLACLMFAFELQRRSDVAGWGIESLAAHPGIARTDLLHNAPGRSSTAGIARSLLWFLFQPASRGALPTLFAATSPDAQAGGYFGPGGLGETRGFPAAATPPEAALEDDVARRLWNLSERLAAVDFGAEGDVPETVARHVSALSAKA
ncbi:SDR family oxidoreductase [Aurantimonas sp. 22II-16-19i]|uniref:SDR family oxidoreductase n=1 Tax=Aurantimonas sp. 22II-16-19i TaxID=1317114 RepID=UPI0009F7E7C4|nr:SDR family oxidoreductase [Aurantimonas sp. 22II-16-19i]ORE97514.1 short-chain dehydrogenase [Aurantimonas sp. 22II-16-19i]